LKPSPILLEIPARAWLRELSDQAGAPLTLAEIPEAEIDRWQRLGCTHIWLMGVWQVGAEAREVALRHWRASWRAQFGPQASESDVHGSPFGIRDYTIDPRLGEPISLLLLKERLNRAGIRLILDFIPNHFGLDSPEPARHPERFVQLDGGVSAAPDSFERATRAGTRRFAHGRDPFFPPWEDTVQLDYRAAETHEAMTALAQTTSMFGDGLRCDMAMLVLPEIFAETWKHAPCLAPHQTRANFWPPAIAAVRSLQPHAEMIAEVYWDREEELHALGFDYTYNKRVYDFIVRGEFAHLREFLSSKPAGFFARGVHFLENHDEARAASVFSTVRHQAAAAFILFLPGMALLHDGQLEGRREHARIHLSRRVPEPVDPEIAAFYEKLLTALPRTHVRRAAASIARVEALKSAAIPLAIKWRARNGEIDLAVANLEEAFAEGVILNDPELRAATGLNGRVLYGHRADPAAGPAFQLASAGLALRLPPCSAQIIRFARGTD